MMPESNWVLRWWSNLIGKKSANTEAHLMIKQELPEGCVAHIISLTSPKDACRLSIISKVFNSAAQSDAVWDKFIPPDTHTILAHSSLPVAKSKKDLYFALCNNPVLIREGKLSFSLDKMSGKKSYMISARELGIIWVDDPRYWRWVSHPESRFEEVAELLDVCWLEIWGKLGTHLLSPSTVYKAYLVFKFTERVYGFNHLPAQVTVGLEGEQGLAAEGEINFDRYKRSGWLELELGEFFCEGGEVRELKMSCLANGGGHWKSGLIVQGIAVRPKNML